MAHDDPSICSPRHGVPVLLGAALLGLACNGDTTGDDGVSPNLCNIDEPTRLLAAPDDWRLDESGTNFQLHRVDDRLLYGFSTSAGPSDVFLRDLCGGESERVLAEKTGIRSLGVAEFAGVGSVLVGSRGQEDYIVDRLDVAGEDPPQRVDGFDFDRRPGEIGILSVELGPKAIVFTMFHDGAPGLIGAAGIGAGTQEAWTFSPPPNSSAVQIGADILRRLFYDDGVLVHTDDGSLRRYDPRTAGFTDLLSGVRWVTGVTLADREFVLVQDIGDDEAEAVRLVDLADGTSRPVTFNTFVQRSFGREPGQPWAGTWVSTTGELDMAIALRGPDGALVEAYDVATLESFAVPSNAGWVPVAGAPWFGIAVPDPEDTVVAAWDPYTGTVEEKYRGPAYDPSQRRFEWTDGVLKFRDEIGFSLFRLSRVDPDTLATTVEIPRIGSWWRELADGRLLTVFRDSRGDTIAAIDLETGEATTIIADVRWWSYAPELGMMLYTDLLGAEPGLWAMPLEQRQGG